VISTSLGLLITTPSGTTFAFVTETAVKEERTFLANIVARREGQLHRFAGSVISA
jgi:hypothetical protein